MLGSFLASLSSFVDVRRIILSALHQRQVTAPSQNRQQPVELGIVMSPIRRYDQIEDPALESCPLAIDHL
jgi:hypothetical protein